MSKPLVSISLLCSNRKDTIRKCLDSLQPLRDAVSTELVLVDTGCDEQTRAILEEYTDQIVDFEWCNDFSKARNAGLEKCSGEWLLFIDDDEWFIDMDEIIDFFLSGRYKNYHHALYIVRNYTDYKESSYGDAWVSRMIRIQKDTKFVSSIHEFFFPAIGEPAMLHSIVKHFGYVFDSKEARYKHSERNISLLWNMVEKERNTIRWWAHLIQEYFMIEEYNKLIEVCDQALELFRKSDRFVDVRDKAVFYVGKILAAKSLHQMEKAKEFYEDAMADSLLLSVARGALYKVGTEVYYTLGDIQTCKACGRNYINIYDTYISDEQELQKQTAFLVKDEYTEQAHSILMSIMVSIYLKEKEWDKAIQYFGKMNWEIEKTRIHRQFVPDLVECFAAYECNDVLIEIAQKIMLHPKIAPVLITEIQKLEDVTKVAEIFSHVGSMHYYVWYLKILYGDQIQDTTEMQEHYEKLFACVLDVLNFDDKLWDIARKYQVNIDTAILNVPFDNWKSGVDGLCKHNDLEKVQKRYDILHELQQTENIRYEYLELKVAEKIAADETEEDYEVCRTNIWNFVEKSLLFYQKFFTEAAFEGEMEMLPASCRAAVKLYDAFAKEESGDYKKVLEDLKAVIGVYQPMDAAIQKYSKLYGQAVVEQQKKDPVALEMEALAKQLRQKAQELMDAGDVENAQMILKQIAVYFPS